MGLPIVSGDGSSALLTIDDTTKAARVLLYASNGQPLALADQGSFTPGTTQGMPAMGHDGPVARVMRMSSNGDTRGGESTPLFSDSTEGAAVDTNKWAQTLTTMTVTQAAGLGILLNAGSSVATTVGALLTTNVRFPFVGRNALVFRARATMSAHSNNNLHELGFGSPATATAASIGDGAVWRKDGSGQWVPVITFATGGDVLGTPISDATFRAAIALNAYAIFEIFLEDGRCTFRIFTTSGALVNEQVVPFSPSIGTFGVTRLQAMLRNYNAAAVAAAVQMRVSQTSVWYTDRLGPSPDQLPVWNNNGSLTSPTLYTQLANFTNSAAAAGASLSNTASGYPTPGGLFLFTAPAGAETDYALFAYQVPVPFGFTVQRVAIDAINTGAAVATTPTVLQWGLAFGSSAVSLATAAPYPPMRKALGFHSWPVGAAIGASGGPQIVWQGREKIQPSRFLHIFFRAPIGTATASQVIRGTAVVDGFFE
jgi:hypothetical protein